MIRRLILPALLLACAAPLAAQAPDTARLRTELVRSRGFLRAAETQLTKTLAVLDSLRVPARVDTVRVVRVDTVLRIDTVRVPAGPPLLGVPVDSLPPAPVDSAPAAEPPPAVEPDPDPDPAPEVPAVDTLTAPVDTAPPVRAEPPPPPILRDGERVVFASPEVAAILGPQLASGGSANPWPFFDENAASQGLYHGGRYEGSPGERMYYDQGLVQYLNYYRTGDVRFLEIARRITDHWYAGYKGSTAQTPRGVALGGIMLRALDGRPELWDYIVRWADRHWTSWLGRSLDSPNLHYGVRDGGYVLLYTAWLAQVHPDSAVRARMAARALRAGRDYYARLQHPDGSWRWKDSAGTPGFFQQPFMVGLLLEALIETHEVTGDTAVARAILKSVENLYTVGYRKDEPVQPADKAKGAAWRGMWYFVYGDQCQSGCGNTRLNGGWDTNTIRSVRQMNATVVHAFGYAYVISGEAKYRTMGDEVFAATFGKGRGPGADAFYSLADFRAKEYNQSYRSAGRYLAWRAMEPVRVDVR